jgi:hypothetical protein
MATTFTACAGKYDDDERNYKFVGNEHTSFEAALAEYHSADDYPFAFIEARCDDGRRFELNVLPVAEDERPEPSSLEERLRVLRA